MHSSRKAQAPLAIIELQLAGDRQEHVRLYADRDGREDVVLAVRENEPVALLVPRDQLTALLAPVVTLRNRTLPLTDGAIDRVRLERDDGQVFVFIRTPAGWNLEGGEGEAVDNWQAERFETLRNWLQAPQAAAWTAWPELPRGPITRLSLGHDRPAYVVNVQQNLASRTDLPGVFQLPAEIAQAMGAEYRDTLIVPWCADQITQVQVSWEPPPPSTPPSSPPTLPSATPAAAASPESMVISRADRSRYVDQNDVTLDTAPAAILFDNLAGLQAKRFVTAPASPAEPPPWQLRIVDRQGTPLTLSRQPNGIWHQNDRTFTIDQATDQRLTDSLERLRDTRP